MNDSTELATTQAALVLRQLMAQAPGGPISISELARRTGVNRASIHRQFQTGRIAARCLQVYSQALGVSPGSLANMLGQELAT